MSFLLKKRLRDVMEANHPHKEQLARIRHIVDLTKDCNVMSVTFDSCVAIAPNMDEASMLQAMLEEQGYQSDIIKGHFIDCYYLPIRYV